MHSRPSYAFPRRPPCPLTYLPYNWAPVATRPPYLQSRFVPCQGNSPLTPNKPPPAPQTGLVPSLGWIPIVSKAHHPDNPYFCKVSKMSLFSPIQHNYSDIYIWITSPPNTTPPANHSSHSAPHPTTPNSPSSTTPRPTITPWIFALTTTPHPIRQHRRYSPMAYYAKITNATPHHLTSVLNYELESTLRSIRKELLALGLPIFDSLGNPPTPPDASDPHNLSFLPDQPIQSYSSYSAQYDPHPVPSEIQEAINNLPDPDPDPDLPPQNPHPLKPPSFTSLYPDIPVTPPPPEVHQSILQEVSRLEKLAASNRKYVRNHRKKGFTY